VRKIPSGKGMFIWMVSESAHGSLIDLAARAQEAGLSWVAIKTQNGGRLFQEALAQGAVDAFRAIGVDVWGWGYLGGAPSLRTWGTAADEARATVETMRRLGLSGFIIDAESEYKRAGSDGRAKTYIAGVRSTLPDLSLGFCSFRFPRLHPEIPWSTFLGACDFHMPQVYWQAAHNPREQLIESRRQLLALKDLPYIPVGSAYAEHGWAPTIQELDVFDQTARDIRLPGITWWSWQALDNHPDWWAAIAAHQWAPPGPPAPVPFSKLPEAKRWELVERGLKQQDILDADGVPVEV